MLRNYNAATGTTAQLLLLLKLVLTCPLESVTVHALAAPFCSHAHALLVGRGLRLRAYKHSLICVRYAYMMSK